MPYRLLLYVYFFGKMTLQAQAVKKNITQPGLGTRTVTIMTVAGFRFKDLNRNGQLDPYEDWRLTSEQRSKDLLARMSMEEKVGFMLISSAGLKNETSFGSGAGNGNAITSDFNEEDRVSTANVFTEEAFALPYNEYCRHYKRGNTISPAAFYFTGKHYCPHNGGMG